MSAHTSYVWGAVPAFFESRLKQMEHLFAFIILSWNRWSFTAALVFLSSQRSRFTLHGLHAAESFERSGKRDIVFLHC